MHDDCIIYPMKILIVEDEYNLADAISSMLQANHYQTEIRTNGKSGAEEAISGRYSLVILDVMLPGMNGFEILDEIRHYQPETKVIMLTAKGELPDKLKGLRNGADDYMTKPFHMEELLARVDLQLKKNSGVEEEALKFEDIKLDMKTGTLSSSESGRELPVAGKEYSLLEYFLEHPNQILSREQLYNRVWGWDNNIESNNLEAYISFIRKKLRLLDSRVQIKAVRGLGYKISAKSE